MTVLGSFRQKYWESAAEKPHFHTVNEMLARHSMCRSSLPVALPKRVATLSKLVRIVVQFPVELKEQLDALKQQRYTTRCFIRATLERELNRLDPPDSAVRGLWISRACALRATGINIKATWLSDLIQVRTPIGGAEDLFSKGGILISEHRSLSVCLARQGEERSRGVQVRAYRSQDVPISLNSGYRFSITATNSSDDFGWLRAMF